MFDDFLIALCELIKTCKFCSDICTKKSLRDQIIEGLRDPETIEDLLKERDLTLDTTIMRCRSREAAKKYRSDLSQDKQSTLAAVRAPTQARVKIACSGCGGSWHKAGRQQCPAYNRTCTRCHKVGHFARVCRSRLAQQPVGQNSPGANAIHVDPHNPIQLFSLSQQVAEPAPRISVHIITHVGTKEVSVLPDSGADISAAGEDALATLGYHPLNLLPSMVVPKAVNGQNMQPIGCVPVTLQLNDKQ